jgi:hypothetical protein
MGAKERVDGSYMQVKLFEVRDRATFIPVLAVRLLPSTDQESWLLAESGYGLCRECQGNYILLMRLHGGSDQYESSPHYWGGSRTMKTAHEHIIDNWWNLQSGAVIDVEYVLGEAPVPKVSQRKEGE